MLPRSDSFPFDEILRSGLLAVSQDLLVRGREPAVAASFDFAFAGKRRHVV